MHPCMLRAFATVNTIDQINTHTPASEFRSPTPIGLPCKIAENTRPVSFAPPRVGAKPEQFLFGLPHHHLLPRLLPADLPNQNWKVVIFIRDRLCNNELRGCILIDHSSQTF